MTDDLLLGCPCCAAATTALPEKGARVLWVPNQAFPFLGVVQDADPRLGRLLVLRDGATSATWYDASDWEVMP